MNDSQTLGVKEAASLLLAEDETVMMYARRGELPGTRIGKSWVFIREDVLAFLRSRIAVDTASRRRDREIPPAILARPAQRRGRRKNPPDLPSLPSASLHMSAVDDV